MLSQLSDDALFDKRRIARACDACNQLRVKCDGQSQCQHCTECGYTCSYARPVKKRGKIPGRPPMRRKINSSPSSSQAPTFPSEFNTPRGGEFGLQPSPTKVHSEDSMTNSMVQEPPVVLPTNDPSTRPFDHISPLSPLRMNHSPEMGWPGQHEVNGRHRSSSVSEDTTTLPRLAPEWRRCSTFFPQSWLAICWRLISHIHRGSKRTSFAKALSSQWIRQRCGPQSLP